MTRRFLAFFAAVTTTSAFSVTMSGSEATALATVDVTASGTFTYTIDPLAEVVRVNIELDVQAEQYPRPAGDDCPYFDFPIPATLSSPVENVLVAPGTRGRTVRDSLQTFYTNIEERPGWAIARTPAECDTYRRQVAHHSISYAFYGGPPRSVFEVRSSAAYFLFPIELFGDPGKINVAVTAPSDYVVDGLGDGWVESSANGATTFTQLGVADPEGFTAVVSARNDSLLRRSELTTPDETDFLLQHWTSDPEWPALVGQEITSAVPLLTDAIGQPWPFVTPVDVRELPTPAIDPSSAWTTASQQLLQIGEDVDQRTTVRQLSHAWFNDTWFSERWLADGFAATYADVVLTSLGDEPATSVAPDTSSPDSFPLADWTTPTTGPATSSTDAAEQYGGHASTWVVTQLLGEIGPQKMGEVLAAVASGETTYVGDAAAETWSETTDWRHLLDLLEDIGGSTQAQELFREFVVPADDLDALTARNGARAAYRDLVTTGNGWAPPEMIRRLLHEWQFEEAMDAIDVANEMLAIRDELDDATAAAGLTTPAVVENTYENATEVGEARSTLDDYLEAARLLQGAVEARDGGHGLFGSIGLLGVDLSIPVDEAADAFAFGDLETARHSAQAAIDDADSATSSGVIRIALIGALGGALTLFVRRRRRATKGSDSRPPDDDGASGATLTP